MNCLIDRGKSDTALAFFQQLKRLGLSANAYTYVILIKAYCRRGNLDEAIKVFEDMEEAGVTPSAFAHTTLIDGLCMHGKTPLGMEESRGPN
ncbi:hypothetical protein IFM89_016420 [Coptis chinensis]|uniref:Pentatricopeptide repeat-containing protein n=1 Tax=Coptis chinensis TaxID=261450 RepID=A0A835LMW2_9MAGN|nr:hypothetical protein IFM89_016420 [Coptis chinensis]